MSDRKYAEAGVDYGIMDPTKVAAQRAAAATVTALIARGVSPVDATRGESAFVLDIGSQYLTFVTEALGTKAIVADEMRRPGRSFYDFIARDTVATILNDLCTVGGEPLSVSAYWAAGASDWFADDERMLDLVNGWAFACKSAGVSWGGGETQALETIIAPDRAVLGGAAIGRIQTKEHLLHSARLVPGDRILMAGSTGVHANGLSLARSIATTLPHGLRTPMGSDPQSRPIGEALLDPAPLYGPLVESLQRHGIDVHYAAHITGHGWRKLMRASRDLTYRIEQLPRVPEVLRFLQTAGGLSDKEMYGTFNMGAGFALFVGEKDAQAARNIGQQTSLSLEDVGLVEAGPKRVLLDPIDIDFSGESLRIRLDSPDA